MSLYLKPVSKVSSGQKGYKNQSVASPVDELGKLLSIRGQYNERGKNNEYY